MSELQADLFGDRSSGAPVNDEIVVIVRAQLRATLELVKSAEVLPWTDQLEAIHADNAFRYGKDALPPSEAQALWAEFDAEMNRLYAVMNEGKEPDLGD